MAWFLVKHRDFALSSNIININHVMLYTIELQSKKVRALVTSKVNERQKYTLTFVIVFTIRTKLLTDV
jgi:hypothetical protein